jgi:exo-1,4-beta-D-glucosaminidase
VPACSGGGTECLQPAERLLLRSGWQLQSSAALTVPPQVISTQEFDPAGWHPAHVPSTVVGTLIEDGVYPNPFEGLNLRALPGMGPQGAIDVDAELPADSPFRNSWWYRTTFDLPAARAGQRVWLTLDGVNYRANVWLNGSQVATSGEVAGTYSSFQLDVTGAARAGTGNVLAIEVFPQHPDDLGIEWMDWNPMPPDKDLGLWRDVWISLSGPVAIRNPQVRTTLDLPSAARAHLEVTTELWNATKESVDGTLRGAIGNVSFQQAVAVPPRSSKTVIFSAPAHPQLDVTHPALWWPAQYGPQELQTLKLEFVPAAGPPDRASVRFGIRQVTSELTPEGHRLFSVNGKRILIRGAGWARSMLLMETPDREDREMGLARDLGLNAIRFEGKFASDHLLDLADELGILVLSGWSCCDVWERSAGWNAAQFQAAEASMRSMALRLRNRPSTLAWLYGSDKPPSDTAEAMYLRVLSEMRWPAPVLSSAGATPTSKAEPSGVKMAGPYDWVPPEYWLGDQRWGGAFGFATEIGPGIDLPEIESLRKTLGPYHLWPIDAAWDFHAAGGVFGNLRKFTPALEARLGAASSLADYVRKAQAMAYEAERAMFESYSRRKYLATGVIQWMLNSAWPSLSWNLYDYYLAAAGAYYGSKKALEPLHVQYSADDRAVVVVNAGLQGHRGLAVRAQVLTFDLQERYAFEALLDVGPDSSTLAFVLPAIAGLSKVYFVRLELRDTGAAVISTNFYWLSTAPDVVDWANIIWSTTPLSAYADLTALAQLPPVRLDLSSSEVASEGDRVVSVAVTNPTSRLAFMVRLKLTQGPGGPEVLPTRWEDNYFSLLPGETRTLAARFLPEDAQGVTPVVEVSGWNVIP